MAEKQKLRALVFPFPLQGHITPAINLVLKLASRDLAITFVNLEFVHKMLSKVHKKTTAEFDLFFEARKSGLDIRYTTISDGLPEEFDRVVRYVEFLEYMMNEFQPLVDEFVEKIIRSDPDSKYFLVADTFFCWQAAAADKFNLVHVSIWTEPALVLSIACHRDLLREKGHYPLKNNVEEVIDYIPGIQTVNTKDFMPYLRESNIDTVSFKFGTKTFDLVPKADFVLHNTVQQLESSTLSALSKYQPNYAIGPINFYKDLTKSSIDKSLWVESSCTNWLQSKAPGSVLYISFGSLVPANKQVVEEITHGLILSHVNFIWITRDGVEGSHHILPNGLEEKLKDTGLIIPWCDQTMVLSHPAIGGFLTHCGWNSVMESIWYGIPMLCYPLDYDQPINRKLVVDDWQIGFNLQDGKKVDRNDVAEKIKSLMTGNISRDSYKIKHLSDMLRNAIQHSGSSERNINKFITDLKEKLRVKGAEEEALNA